MVNAVIDIRLAHISFVSRRAVAAAYSRRMFNIYENDAAGIKVFIPKAALFQDLACGPVAARIAVTGVDSRFAQLAVVARCADALVVPFASWPTSGTVLAGECVTGVTLGQDLIRHLAYLGDKAFVMLSTSKVLNALTFALEAVSWRGKQQLVAQQAWLCAARYTWLNVVAFHPFRKPAKIAIAIEWVRAKSPMIQHIKVSFQ